MHVVVVYNPKSGTALAEQEIKTLFHDAGIMIDAIIGIDQTIKRKLKKPIASKATIAVIGGDGTISTVAGIVAGTDTTLLTLPGGTLNHFTKDLGIDQDIKVALRKAVSAKVRKIDIASVNDTYFINNSSIGLYPSSLRDRNRFEDRLGKWPAAVIASIRSLVRFHSLHVTIDGRAFRTPFVFIGNNRYDIDSVQASRKRIDEGILSVFVARTDSRLEAVKIVGLALVGRASKHEKFDVFTTKSLTIDTKRRRVVVSYDGEFKHVTSPLKYEIKSKVLRVLK